MNELLEVLISSVVIALLLVAIILFGGEPDLADSVMRYIDKKTEMLSCPTQHIQLN